MNLQNIFLLIFLSAIWGSSFLFQRIAVPVYGPGWMVFFRIFSAALFLSILMIVWKKEKNLFQHSKYFSIIAFLNSAFPFFLFATASQTLTASEMSVLNATAPAWGYIIGLTLKREEFTLKRISGIILGILGVAMIFKTPKIEHSVEYYKAVFYCLLATFCYGLATNYVKKAKAMDSFSTSYGSMWFSTLMLTPVLFFTSMKSTPTIEATASVLAVGVLCTGFAYLLYYKLVLDIGATSALTVTFLIPVFGTLWGVLFLGEKVSMSGVVGMLVVVLGTVMVTGFSYRSLLKRQKPSIK